MYEQGGLCTETTACTGAAVPTSIIAELLPWNFFFFFFFFLRNHLLAMCGFVRSSCSSCEVTNEIHYFRAFSKGAESGFVKIFCHLKSQAEMTEEINCFISHLISLFFFRSDSECLRGKIKCHCHGSPDFLRRLKMSVYLSVYALQVTAVL